MTEPADFDIREWVREQYEAIGVTPALRELYETYKGYRKTNEASTLAASIAGLPPHYKLSISHNPHGNSEETVASYCEDEMEYPDEHWVSEEQRQKATDTNDFWSMVIYLCGPCDCYVYYAADLDVLLEHVRVALKDGGDDNA